MLGIAYLARFRLRMRKVLSVAAVGTCYLILVFATVQAGAVADAYAIADLEPAAWTDKYLGVDQLRGDRDVAADEERAAVEDVRPAFRDATAGRAPDPTQAAQRV